MAGKLRVTQVEKAPEYFEFDYTHPEKNCRVRRKVLADQYQADLLKDLLNITLEQHHNRNDVFRLLNTTRSFTPHRDFLMACMESIYFPYCDEPTDDGGHEATKQALLESKIPLNNLYYDRVFCLLGKAGVGKSTIIRKLSPFPVDGRIPFPYTETSRTTTYPTDYCFVSKTTGFKFLAVFKPAEVIDMYIRECIERGVYKLIELQLNPSTHPEADIDTVMNSFFSDSSQIFDIHFSLGKYFPRKHAGFSKPENQEMIGFWQTLFASLSHAVGLITKGNQSDSTDITHYQVVFSDAIKAEDDKNPIYQEYLNIKNLIHARSKKNRDTLIQELRENKAINSEQLDIKIDDNSLSYFYCEIDKIVDEPAFYDFIKAFTTKHSSEFGHSLFNLVDHLRIELPLNTSLKMPDGISNFAIQDTIGVAHAMNTTGGFENSTNLNLGNVDSVILVEDSQMNADNNTTAILRHLVNRMDLSRIYFAFTFFDKLEKGTFDKDDDMDRQREDYLAACEISAIKSMALDDSKASELIRRVESGKSTVFLSGLMDVKKFDSTQSLLDSLASVPPLKKEVEELHRLSPDEHVVSYDFKKLPLIYAKALDSFRKSQKQIYEIDPPHYKTTEALTNRLSLGQTYFNGARNLRPVDDLFDSLSSELSPFIEAPVSFNLVNQNNPSKRAIISQMRIEVTERLRRRLNQLFLGKKDEWYRLYALSGNGSDRTRRDGILKTEDTLTPNTDYYLYSIVKKHLIMDIEEIFQKAILALDNKCGTITAP